MNMNAQPTTFTLPIARFDVDLLPPGARQVGTDAFKDAVVLHFSAKYAAMGQQAIVTVDDDDITVVTVPEGAEPIDFVLSLLQAGKLEEAVPLLEGMSRASPKDAQVLYNLGIAYSELGQFDEAIIRLKKAVQLDPKHAHAWTGIGVAYQRLGKRDQALEPMKRAVEADPSDGYARRNLGAMLLGAGDHDGAINHLRAARRALPNDAQTLYGLAAALDAAGGDSNQEEADELYLVVIQKFPGSQAAELAREARTKLAQQSMRSKVGGGLRPDVMMYIAGALDTFDKLGPTKRQQITMEIAMLGQHGLDINDSEQKYTLKTLPGKFSGMHLVSIMYAGMKALDPNLDGGIDLSAEYQAALAMRGK